MPAAPGNMDAMPAAPDNMDAVHVAPAEDDDSVATVKHEVKVEVVSGPDLIVIVSILYFYGCYQWVLQFWLFFCHKTACKILI